MKQAQLVKMFEAKAQMAQVNLDKFMVKFQEDPSYALSWGNDTFRAAAELKIAKQILAALEHSATLENIRSTLTNRMLNMAKYPAQSTSPTSNLIEQYELAACASIVSQLSE